MKNFRTYHLAIEFYNDCKTLKLRGALKDQFDRALLSIPLNLAEGSAKPTAKDRRRFYFIALGSMREIETILHLQGTPDLSQKANVLAAHICKLCQNTC